MKSIRIIPKISPLMWTAFTGLTVILFSIPLGVVPRQFFAEEFFVLHYANNFDHITAFWRYFLENGRLIEALYWTYSYKLLGFAPLFQHTLSLVLLLIASILAAKCFLRVWPGRSNRFLIAFLLVFLIYFNWVSNQLGLKISTDNGRLSLIFFFMAGHLLQNWAATGRARWLLSAYGTFLLSVFTYENTVLLFPALLLLAAPLRSQSLTWKREGILFLALSLLSFGAALLPLPLYDYLDSISKYGLAHPALGAGSPLEFAIHGFVGLPAAIATIGNSGLFFGGGWSILLTLGVMAVLVLSASTWVSTLRSTKLAGSFTFVYLACLWIFLFGMLPYVAAGYGVTARVYSSSLFGLFGLLVLAFESPSRLIRILCVLLMLLFTAFGFYETVSRAMQINEREVRENIMYRGLKQVVPSVQPKTVFIFINNPLSNSGCGPSLEMLYDQTDLHCAFLSSSLEEYWAIRHASLLETNRGGFLRDQNWILIAIDETGKPYVVEELRPDDSNLRITWEVQTPIQTDFNRIVEANSVNSQFYLHLILRQAQLGLP